MRAFSRPATSILNGLALSLLALSLFIPSLLTLSLSKGEGPRARPLVRISDRERYGQLWQIDQKASASRLAPPTSAPLTSAMARISSAFAALTEPP